MAPAEAQTAATVALLSDMIPGDGGNLTPGQISVLHLLLYSSSPSLLRPPPASPTSRVPS